MLAKARNHYAPTVNPLEPFRALSRLSRVLTACGLMLTPELALLVYVVVVRSGPLAFDRMLEIFHVCKSLGSTRLSSPTTPQT
jgi:hypothetical protein